MYDEQRKMLIEAFDCDHEWNARMSDEIPNHEAFEKLVLQRTRMQDEFATSHDPMIREYGMIWDRAWDLGVDIESFVAIESDVFSSVGTTEHFPTGIGMLEKIIRLFKRAAEEELTIRQFEYVFKTHVIYS